MEKNPFQAAILTTSLGLQFAASIAIGYYTGNYLDRRFDSGQTFMIAGIVLGIMAGVVGAVKMVKPFLDNRS